MKEYMLVNGIQVFGATPLNNLINGLAETPAKPVIKTLDMSQ